MATWGTYVAHVADPQRVQRFDFGTLGKAEQVPGGGIRVPAYVARTGIQTYRDGSGKEWREYRDASEVFAADSLATYPDAPITVGHPPAMLTLDNRGQYARGHVREASEAGDYRADGERWVAAHLTVTDPPTVRRVLARELTEVSMGYEAETLPSRRADADTEQRSIRINHLALLEPGGARAGRGATLKLDSSGAVAIEPQTINAGAEARLGAAAPKGPQTMTVKIKIDGRDVEEGSAEHIGILQARIDAATGARDTLQAKLDAETEAHTATKAELASAQERIDAVELSALAQRLAPLTGDLKLDGLTKRDLMIRAIASKLDGFTGEGRSDAYLEGRLDAILAEPQAPKSTAPRLDGGAGGLSLVQTPQGLQLMGPGGRQLGPADQARLDSQIAYHTAADTYTSPIARSN